MSAPLVTRLMTMTCVIQHRGQTGAEDEFGTPTYVTTTTESACYLEQRRRDDVRSEGDDIGLQEWWLFLPPNTPLDDNDRVDTLGQTFEVAGPPWDAWNPTHTVVSHIECTLRKVA